MTINPISYTSYAPGLTSSPTNLAQGASPSTIADQPSVNVDVNFPRAVRSFTAEAGDSYRVATLFKAQGVDSAYTYTVVARGGGALQLDGAAVDPNTKTTFTSDEFNRLSFLAGGIDSDIAVVAQNGTTTSDAFQITAKTGSTRSLDALPALYSSDPLATLAFGATLTAGSNTALQPKITAAGNFTAVNGDLYRVAALINVAPASGSSITSYNLAVRGGGALVLDGADIDPNTKTSFTSDEFNRLQYRAGSTSTDILVSATGSNGIGAPAVGLTQSVGTSDFDRTINGEAARYSAGAYGLIAFSAALTQSATKGASPSIATVGDFQAESGESYRVASLFSGKTGSSGAIDTYLVAAKGGGSLLLDGAVVDPNTKTSFTADEFARLQFSAAGSDSKLVVAAQAKGISSSAVEITAETASQTSFNALASKYNPDAYALIAFSANLLNPSGSAAGAPKLSSVGNFSGGASDTYRIANLFTASGSPTSYNVAARGTGTLTLDGATIDPNTQTSFTSDEFNRLVFVPGAGQADLVVSALSGTTSSQAVQISASIGNRSTNAAAALYSQDYFTQVGYNASLQNQFVSSGAPSLSTVGNFTAVNNQTYRLAALYSGTQGASAISTYNVAIRGGGSLTLDGATIDSTTQSSFTADEFNRLVFKAGASDSDLVVAASDGSRSSQALQITATAAATTSLNAGAASYGNDPFLLVGFTASLLRGTNAAARPQFSVTGSFGSQPNSLAYNNANNVIGGQEVSGTFGLDSGNQIGIANLFSSSATGGLLAVGPRSAGQPSLFEVLAESNAGIGARIATNNAQRSVAYRVLAYEAAGRL
jgi:hypothetical protein